MAVPARGLSQPPVGTGCSLPTVNWPDSESDDLPACNAEVEIEWGHTSTPHIPSWRAQDHLYLHCWRLRTRLRIGCRFWSRTDVASNGKGLLKIRLVEFYGCKCGGCGGCGTINVVRLASRVSCRWKYVHTESLVCESMVVRGLESPIGESMYIPSLLYMKICVCRGRLIMPSVRHWGQPFLFLWVTCALNQSWLFTSFRICSFGSWKLQHVMAQIFLVSNLGTERCWNRTQC